MKIRKPSRLLPALLAAVILAGGAAILYERNAARPVELVSPHPGLAVEAIYATGTVEPLNWAKIGAVTTGRIAEILVEEGDSVRLGQQLARLDDREARAKVAELEARAAYWREEMKRAETLAARGIRAPESAQKAKSEYDQAVAAINAARQRRADLLVTAPMDGVVLRKDGETGEVVKPENTIFWVGEARPLRVTADVDEEDIAKVAPGQKVLIKADAFPDRALTGQVDQITPKGDPVNKTFRVRVALPDDTPLMVGMTAEINIITAEKPQARLIPASAVGKDDVLVEKDGRAETRSVTIGIRGRDQVEIVDGLADDERVVASPPAGLKSGDRIKAR
ncbi:efflux RND transporter periplasmic adaptor subunit [Magnetospirillum sp. 64-120]|uniref:efflux RND transporter periplasmic adaptor subunit n=1 Tax=Magnetospirillum sp. 64-120 TaxID=1895778 RepID=UPI00092BAD45|nr:efflux RND transporter periplasmic adaptor subunit [Magnetospirillum sp. 64-120]OJX72135.1 MAG: efflux transporter periplasmic adaptor subunit [Magnetospirillum sp. 64-120]